MARLVVLSEGFNGRAHELKVVKTTVGRVDDNVFQVPDQSVSSHHCEIILRGKEVVVKDLNSTNGSFINGKQVTEAVLQPGQILRLGQVEMKLEAEGAAPAGAVPASGKKVLEAAQSAPRGVKLNDLMEFVLWQAQADRLGIALTEEHLHYLILTEFFYQAGGLSEEHLALASSQPSPPAATRATPARHPRR